MREPFAAGKEELGGFAHTLHDPRQRRHRDPGSLALFLGREPASVEDVVRLAHHVPPDPEAVAKVAFAGQHRPHSEGAGMDLLREPVGDLRC